MNPMHHSVSRGQDLKPLALRKPARPSISFARSRPISPHLQRRPACACGGTCPNCRGETRAAANLQPKLAVNEPGDAFEQEADRVADQVMRMPEPGPPAEPGAVAPAASPVPLRRRVSALQRKCVCGGSSGACDDCKADSEEKLQRRASDRRGPATAPPIVHEVLRSPGQPLDAATRAFMEPRFGRDFGDVQVHTGGKAAESAGAVNARAYTVGNHVVFAAGQFMPTAPAGQRLLAHELAHVTQQSNHRTAVQLASSTIGQPHDASRRKADQTADAVMGSGATTGLRTDGGKSGGSVMLQRTIGDGHDLQSPRFAGDPVLEACFDDERLLRFGSRGPAVEKIQQALVDAGFPLPVFGVDQIFGSETRTAVQNYQRAHGLDPDGIVGPLTMGHLDALFTLPPLPPPETITSQTVATSPGLQTRTTIGVGEQVNLTHAPGSAAWTAPGATLSATNATNVILTAPDTGPQRIRVTAGTATPLDFDVVAPTGVHMDPFPGTGLKHTVNRPDSGMATRPFLLPDTVNFLNVTYHEMNLAGVPTVPGVYSCNPSNAGHCLGVALGAACNNITASSTVIAGKGTLMNGLDCVWSGECGGLPPFVPGSLTINVPYQYSVGTGAFHPFATVAQVHTLAPNASTLTTSKAGASITTTVAAASGAIAQCP